MTEIVNVWRHDQLLLLSLNSRSTCFGSKLSACFHGTWVGLNVMFTWNMAGLKGDVTVHMAGIYMTLMLWSIWKEKMLEISLLLLKTARIQLTR